MNGETWRSARALFEESLALLPERRRAFLEERTGANPEALAEALSLLAAHEEAGSFLAGGEVGAFAGGAPPLAEPTRERIGAYRVRSKIGAGGMGAVYLAERVEGGFEQRVAIKVVAGAAESAEVLRRFEFERRILSTLDHPGIARILDGGTTDDGLPYFVMDFVEGRTLLEYAAEERLDLASRLRLFLEVCAAVEHAHRRSVIHRDLKPSNILVGEDGHARLLDFGISKLVDGKGGEGEPGTRTVTAQRWLTPAWASPEQIRGDVTTTATDVYSLGLILFELLTGRPAVERGSGSPGAIEAAILEGRIRRPSSVAAGDGTDALEPAGSDEASRRHLARALRGDLDTIVLKATAVEPARRYGSVAELADEIERHLGGRPVRARPDTLGYRSVKFIRRHRAAVALSSIAGLALVVGLALALLGLTRARRAEQRARTEAETASRVSEFLVDLFRISDPGEARGNAVTARELLDRGAKEIDEQLSAQPAVRARMLAVIGRAYGALGIYDAGAGALEAELAALRELHGADAPELAAPLTALAVVESRRGAYAQALASSGEAIRLLEAKDSAASIELARALEQQGIAHWYLGDLAAASRAMDRSLAVRDALPRGEDEERVGTLNNAAILRWQLGDIPGARALYERALALVLEVHGEEHPDVASTLNNLAILELEADRADRARELHERALALRRKLLAADHPDVAESLNNLGEALRAVHEPEAARAALEEALAIREKALGPVHPAVATTLSNLGAVLVELGETERARPLLERALAAFTTAVGPDHFFLSYPLVGLAELEEREHRPERAEAHLRRALVLRTASLGADHAETKRVGAALERLLAAKSRIAEAPAAPRPAVESSLR
jgi:eukaryotic-like serine/threonine-protein kinase